MQAGSALRSRTSGDPSSNTEEALVGIFEGILEKVPDAEVPGVVDVPKGLSLKEKARRFAKRAVKAAGKELKTWFGDANAELLYELVSAAAEEEKKTRVEKVKSTLAKIFYSLSQGSEKESCSAVKKDGRRPEARLGHSPLPLFGYPMFDDSLNATVLERRGPLNVVNGFPIPITVGAFDYVIQGRLNKVLSFLECFGEYEVRAQTLFPNGHWSYEPLNGIEPRPLYVQITGVMQGGSVKEILAREALNKVVGRLDFHLQKQGLISTIVKEALAGDLTPSEYVSSIAAATLELQLKTLRSYLSGKDEDFEDLVEQLTGTDTLTERLELIYKFLTKSREETTHWTNVDAIKRQSRITVLLTSYPRPDYNNKATRSMGSPVATLAQIKGAIEEIPWKSLK